MAERINVILFCLSEDFNVLDSDSTIGIIGRRSFFDVGADLQWTYNGGTTDLL